MVPRVRPLLRKAPKPTIAMGIVRARKAKFEKPAALDFSIWKMLRPRTQNN
jgi:hypothetical protein